MHKHGKENNKSIADIFRHTANTDEFRDAVRELRGNFSLAPDDIVLLGEAYLERFPGCHGNEECDDVRDAYEVAKICVIEYLISGLDAGLIDRLRDAFSGVQEIGPAMDSAKSMIGPSSIASLLGTLTTRAEKLHSVLQTLPPSIIKERFSGALAYVMNVVYLMGINAGIA